MHVLDQLFNLFSRQKCYTLRLHLGVLLDKRFTIKTQILLKFYFIAKTRKISSKDGQIDFY